MCPFIRSVWPFICLSIYQLVNGKTLPLCKHEHGCYDQLVAFHFCCRRLSVFSKLAMFSMLSVFSVPLMLPMDSTQRHLRQFVTRKLWVRVCVCAQSRPILASFFEHVSILSIIIIHLLHLFCALFVAIRRSIKIKLPDPRLPASQSVSRTDRPTERQTERQNDRATDRPSDRLMGRLTDKQIKRARERDPSTGATNRDRQTDSSQRLTITDDIQLTFVWLLLHTHTVILCLFSSS